ncbi:hypothetical protein KY285_008510 [Solanum tuberosum]|nr:hypothetical protein KY285_008510 [Solanum tuberosum]
MLAAVQRSPAGEQQCCSSPELLQESSLQLWDHATSSSKDKGVNHSRPSPLSSSGMGRNLRKSCPLLHCGGNLLWE